MASPRDMDAFAVIAKSSFSDDGSFSEFVVRVFVSRAKAEAFVKSQALDTDYSYEINETTLDMS